MAAKKRVASKKRVAERLKAKTSKNPAQKKATPAARTGAERHRSVPRGEPSGSTGRSSAGSTRLAAEIGITKSHTASQKAAPSQVCAKGG